MFRRLALLVLGLVAATSAAAALDAHEPAVTLWSLPIGFACGLASLLVRPARRAIFLAVPVALGTVAITWQALLNEVPAFALNVAGLVAFVAFVLTLQVGAGFLLALLLSLAVRAYQRPTRRQG